MRQERLQKQLLDLRRNISMERTRRQELLDNLDRVRARQSSLASNERRLYQETEMKEMSLATAQKEVEEVQAKELRLRIQMDNLRKGMARFLAKVSRSNSGGGGVVVEVTNEQVRATSDLYRIR